MMNKLTIAQFVEHLNDYGLTEYTQKSQIITAKTADSHGIVIEEDEEILCTGESVCNFLANYPDFDFDKEVDPNVVSKCINAMIGMDSRPHHNAGRRNAAKPESEKATATIHMRCHPDDKALIVRNLKPGETIASFMIGVAVEEAEKRQNQ